LDFRKKVRNNSYFITISKTLILLFALQLCTQTNAQFFKNELTNVLPKSDLAKLTKVESANRNAKKILNDLIIHQDSFKRNPPKYFSTRMKAASLISTANGNIYGTLKKNITFFWFNYRGNKKILKPILKFERSVYMELKEADGIRLKAEVEVVNREKYELIEQAEKIESEALLMYEKIYLTYMYNPENPDISWIQSDDLKFPTNYVIKKVAPKKIK
jgi:hypothetical protein